MNAGATTPIEVRKWIKKQPASRWHKKTLRTATKGDLVEIPKAICAKTAEQFEHHDSGRGSADWAAYLRLLDGIDTSYRN